MHIPARDAQGSVVAADGFGVGRLKQAVHVTAGVVEQLDLADTELVNFAVLRFLRDLLNCLFGQFEVVVKVHELWHSLSPCVESTLGGRSSDLWFVRGNLHQRRLSRNHQRVRVRRPKHRHSSWPWTRSDLRKVACLCRRKAGVNNLMVSDISNWRLCDRILESREITSLAARLGNAQADKTLPLEHESHLAHQ